MKEWRSWRLYLKTQICLAKSEFFGRTWNECVSDVCAHKEDRGPCLRGARGPDQATKQLLYYPPTRFNNTHTHTPRRRRAVSWNIDYPACRPLGRLHVCSTTVLNRWFWSTLVCNRFTLEESGTLATGSNQRQTWLSLMARTLRQHIQLWQKPVWYTLTCSLIAFGYCCCPLI